ncbi:SRPBCC domain-containing protein [bacterium]|nr:MAG: SRPBCC domain-containing protein [bacterium]
MSLNNDLNFSITRVFDAPRDLVWKAYSEAERLAHWWGPKDFPTKVVSLDFREGGMFHYSMQTPGSEMWGKFVYREIVPKERIVFVISFADAEANTVRAPFDPNWPLENLSTVTFAEEDGKTRLTIEGTAINVTAEEIESFKKGRAGMIAGTNLTLDQLVEYLATVSQ